jgi:hypothetical protein
MEGNAMSQRVTVHLTAALYVLSIGPFNALGWSVEGHKAIAEIGVTQLQGTSTATRISSLLGGFALPDIATCPDEVRNLEEHQIPMSKICAQIFPNPPKGTAQWHFVNTPIKAAPFTPTATDVNAACKNNCVTSKITSFLAVLAAAKATDSKAKKLAELQALSFVVHFIGDVHQPLHASIRDNDGGGNAEHIKFFGTDDGGILVLHAIWDRQIVTLIDADPAKLATDLGPEITLAKSEQSGTPTTWAIQSYLPARDVAYKGIPPAPTDPAHKNDDVADLGQPYQDSATPIVRMQIARAGVRLAAALKQALP